MDDHNESESAEDLSLGNGSMTSDRSYDEIDVSDMTSPRPETELRHSIDCCHSDHESG